MPWGDNGTSIPAAFLQAGNTSNAAQFYTDPDGVVRRAMGGLVPYISTPILIPPDIAATTDVGLPMTPANTNGVTQGPQSGSRPVILNRPFRTVGELRLYVLGHALEEY